MIRESMKNSILWMITIVVFIGATLIVFFMPLKDKIVGGNKLVELYYAEHISQAHQEIIDRFNREYEGRIKVIPVDLPFSKFSTNEMKEMLARSLRSKSDRLDILSVDVIWVPRFAKWAYPLNKHFDEGLLEKLSKTALESCYYNGNLVTIPIYIDVGILYYRRDLLYRLTDPEGLEQKIREGMNWSEFIELGKEWEKTGRPYFIFPADNFEGFTCMFHETMSERENQYVFNADSVSLNNAQVRRGLELLHGLINTWELTPGIVTEFDESQCLHYALEHDALFVRGWPGYRTNYELGADASVKLNQLVEAPIPHFPGAEKTGVFGGWNLMISKFSSKKEAALKFIHFIQDKQSQISLYKKGGYFPILNTLYQDSVFITDHPELHYYQYLLRKGRHRPFREDYTQISDILSYYFKMILKNELTIDEALDVASRKINTEQAFIY